MLVFLIFVKREMKKLGNTCIQRTNCKVILWCAKGLDYIFFRGNSWKKRLQQQNFSQDGEAISEGGKKENRMSWFISGPSLLEGSCCCAGPRRPGIVIRGLGGPAPPGPPTLEITDIPLRVESSLALPKATLDFPVSRATPINWLLLLISLHSTPTHAWHWGAAIATAAILAELTGKAAQEMASTSAISSSSFQQQLDFTSITHRLQRPHSILKSQTSIPPSPLWNLPRHNAQFRLPGFRSLCTSSFASVVYLAMNGWTSARVRPSPNTAPSHPPPLRRLIQGSSPRPPVSCLPVFPSTFSTGQAYRSAICIPRSTALLGSSPLVAICKSSEQIFSGIFKLIVWLWGG